MNQPSDDERSRQLEADLLDIQNRLAALRAQTNVSEHDLLHIEEELLRLREQQEQLRRGLMKLRSEAGRQDSAAEGGKDAARLQTENTTPTALRTDGDDRAGEPSTPRRYRSLPKPPSREDQSWNCCFLRSCSSFSV